MLVVWKGPRNCTTLEKWSSPLNLRVPGLAEAATNVDVETTQRVEKETEPLTGAPERH